MGKPLSERITSARSTDRVTITDLKTVIADAREEQARQQARKEAADADAVDIALSEEDRAEASATSASAARLVQAYADAIAELEEKLQGKVESDKRRAFEAEQAAALAERDDIAARFKAAVPDAIAMLTGLFAEVVANKKRLQKAGLKHGVLDAELVARSLSSGYAGHGHVMRFVEMRIPNWDRPRHVWPEKTEVPGGVFDPDRARRQSDGRKAAAKARWGRYRLTPEPDKPAISFEAKMPAPINRQQRQLSHEKTGIWDGDLDHTEADRLRALGVTVAQLDDPEFDTRWIYFT